MSDTTWFKLYHKFFRDPAVQQLSREALVLHICSLSYCSEGLTDGVVWRNPVARSTWAAFVADCDIDQLTDELVDAGLWIDASPQHYEIANYLQYQRSKEQVTQRRAADAARKAKSRQKQQPSPDTDTDTDGTRDSSGSHAVTSSVGGELLDAVENVSRLRSLRGGAA